MTRILVEQHGWKDGVFLYEFVEATHGDIYRDGYADEDAIPVTPVAGDWVQAMYPNPNGMGMDASIRRALKPYGLTLGEQKYGYCREIIPLEQQ